ncbi:TolC family outer membrane protein [Thiohalophilus sp.]|uniref:TolC family outer membrane protein n=1 Tax=Thiohalophilus sp. TaxID=3028392 RepID=UPI002ACEA0E7|nr:TolC family outer membrane protein [Thiohalophilus sp.]MDZ7661038.1 TolC family outer membrane protein [Thiohalophilus sp.]
MKPLQLVTSLSLLLFSLNAGADDLMSIYEQAAKNDPQYRAAAADYRANQEATAQGRAPLLPQVNLTARTGQTTTDYNTYEFDTSREGTSEDYDSTSYSLSLTQALYHHDYYVQLRQADAQVARAEANFRNARQELMTRVAQRYFAYLGAIDNLGFARAEQKAIEQQLNQTEQRFNVGLTAITDVHEARARRDQAEAQTISAENQLAVAREDLREITGMPHEQIAELDKNSPLLRPEPEDIDHWVKTALDHSLLLIAAEKSREIAEEEINRARAGHYPTLDLVADHTHSDTDGGSFGARETEDTAISLQLNVPLYSGGLVASRTREAAARHIQAKEQYIQQRRAIEREIRSAYLSVIANISQVKAFAQALESSRTALEATEAGFEVGTRTAVDVLNSQRELYRAQRDYAQSRYNYILESFRLKQAAGILSEQDIKQVNAWLQ